MDPAAYVDWIMLEQLLKERYPDITLPEAHVKLLQEAFSKLPKEYTDGIKKILPEILPHILEFIRISCGRRPEIEILSWLVNTIRDVVTKLNASKTDTRPAALAEAVTAGVKLAAENMKRASDSADRVVRQVHDIHVIGKSLVDHINYYTRWMQAAVAIQIAQGQMTIQALKEIRACLDESNSITVSGSGGPDGFAQHVYDFVNEATDSVDETKGDKHRFFVFNPDTDWYGAFRRLIRQNPLPSTFCAKSDNLDTLCQYMQAIRTECGPDIVFHLLIPSWCRISYKEPLHFPDDLQPFRVEGRKYRGKPLVEFNLPAAPPGLLHGVANVLDPKSWNMVAGGVSTAVTLPTVGWGVNGICLGIGLGLGAVTGAGALIAIPVWIGTGVPAMSITAPAIEKTIYDALREEAPRILGSNQHLDMKP